MIRFANATFAATLAVGALAVSSLSAAAAKCVMAGGEATMITEDLAKFMSKAALGNSIKGMGATPTGAIALTCKPQLALTYCIARQRACK